MNEIMVQRVIELLKISVFGKEPNTRVFDNMTENDWKTILEYSFPHNIVALTYDGMNALPTSLRAKGSVLALWSMSVEKLESAFQYKSNVFEELSIALAEANIRTILLKGLGLSSYYPVPSHRSFSDIDIYPVGDFFKAQNLVCTLGASKPHEYIHHHNQLFYKDVMIEMHYDFIDVRTHKCNRQLNEILVSLSNQYLGEPFYKSELPSPTLNAIFLMRHMSAHYASEVVSLRHLCDWTVFLMHDGEKVDWTLVLSVFETIGIKRFFNIINSIIKDYFGVSFHFIDYSDDSLLEQRVFKDVCYPNLPSKRKNASFIRKTINEGKVFLGNSWKHKLIFPKESMLYSSLKIAFLFLSEELSRRHK